MRRQERCVKTSLRNEADVLRAYPVRLRAFTPGFRRNLP